MWSDCVTDNVAELEHIYEGWKLRAKAWRVATHSDWDRCGWWTLSRV